MGFHCEPWTRDLAANGLHAAGMSLRQGLASPLAMKPDRPFRLLAASRRRSGEQVNGIGFSTGGLRAWCQGLSCRGSPRACELPHCVIPAGASLWSGLGLVVGEDEALSGGRLEW